MWTMTDSGVGMTERRSAQEIAALDSQALRKLYGIPSKKVCTESIAKDDPDWKQWMKDNAWWYSENLESPGADQKFAVLHRILLTIGGEETCFPEYEEDMEAILSRGYYRKGTSKMMVGRPSQCHANAAELWERNKPDHDVSICTGYALSADGLWRQHSWLVHRYQTATQRRTRVIETTTKRVAYFGFELDDVEAFRFVENNDY